MCTARSVTPRRWRRRWAKKAGQQLHEQAEIAAQELSKRSSGARRLSVYAIALDGAKQPCRVVSSNSGQVLLTGIASPGARGARGRAPCSACMLQRLGHSHARAIRAALQPHVLSQWLGVAARQRTDCAGPGALWPQAGHRADVHRACSTRPPTWICAGCRNCSAASCAASTMRRRNIPWPARRKPGQARRCWRCCRPALGLELTDAADEIAFYRPVLPEFLDTTASAQFAPERRLRRRAAAASRRRCGGDADAPRWRCLGGGALLERLSSALAVGRVSGMANSAIKTASDADRGQREERDARAEVIGQPAGGRRAQGAADADAEARPRRATN